MKDPIGQAILDFARTGKNKDIIVKSDICDDDVIPSSYLFRSFEEMPLIEQIALKKCTGNVLDVGAAAGIHTSYLKEQELDVRCIDISEKSVEYLKSVGHSAEKTNFFEVEEQKFDTVLMLMNGLGIAGSLSNLDLTLLKAKSLLKENGRIIADSSDIKYLYQDDDGSMLIDLNTEYYGNFKFQMVYDEHISDWFDWLYVDFDKLQLVANKIGLSVEKIYEEDNHYLVEIKMAL
tara:strand:- start:9293 stop:9994 length:702 start_codon:yes stop_codon:yes gene_type:complete